MNLLAVSDNFDNVNISSQESDLDVEIVSTKSLATEKHQQNNNFRNSRNFNKLDKFKPSVVLADESSNESEDDVTFIRQISKPLLSNSRNKSVVQKRRMLQQRKRMTKIVGILFISTFLFGLFLCMILLMLPRDTLLSWRDSSWTDKIRKLFFQTEKTVVGCDQVNVQTLWERRLPMMMSEGAARLLYVNDDTELDIVLPFGTNIVSTMKLACSIYFPGQSRCYGGLIALDGVTGQVLWRYDATGEMYALTCSDDLDGDGWPDCLGAGRRGTFAAVNGRTGAELWSFEKVAAGSQRNSIMNLYTAQMVTDQDGDGIRDVLEIHGGDPLASPTQLNRLVAKVMLFSGRWERLTHQLCKSTGMCRTGQILSSKDVPDRHESYYSSQLVQLGTNSASPLQVLVGTGGETYPGRLFAVPLSQLTNTGANTESVLRGRTLYSGPQKGVLTPPVLVDISGDGRPDIVICPFGNECLAIDGVSQQILWRFAAVNSSETYASPAAGFYNEDDVPDIFIQLFVGLGYPVYFYGETIILDGRDGSVLKKLPRSNNVVTSSPLTVSVEGHGNDLFLFWLQLCRGHEKDVDTTPFRNVPQYMLSRVNVCKIRFNTSTESSFLVHGRHLHPVTAWIYSSSRDGAVSTSTNTTGLILGFLRRRPQYWPLYKRYRALLRVSDRDKLEEEQRVNDDAARNYHEFIVSQQRRKDRQRLSVPEAASDETEDGYDKRFLDKVVSDDYDDIPLSRQKRHNGPHDSDGQQRLISTGSLAPSLSGRKGAPSSSSSIDVVFATYWSRAREVPLQGASEVACNRDWLRRESSQRFLSAAGRRRFKGYDHDHYVELGTHICAQKFGVSNSGSEDSIRRDASVFNVHSGELTVFRKTLICSCSPGRLMANQRCARILPLKQQTWPAYLGLDGSAYWNSSQRYLHNHLPPPLPVAAFLP